jgi:hypothetical protein
MVDNPAPGAQAPTAAARKSDAESLADALRLNLPKIEANDPRLQTPLGRVNVLIDSLDSLGPLGGAFKGLLQMFLGKDFFKNPYKLSENFLDMSKQIADRFEGEPDSDRRKAIVMDEVHKLGEKLGLEGEALQQFEQAARDKVNAIEDLSGINAQQLSRDIEKIAREQNIEIGRSRRAQPGVAETAIPPRSAAAPEVSVPDVKPDIPVLPADYRLGQAVSVGPHRGIEFNPNGIQTWHIENPGNIQEGPKIGLDDLGDSFHVARIYADGEQDWGGKEGYSGHYLVTTEDGAQHVIANADVAVTEGMQTQLGAAPVSTFGSAAEPDPVLPQRNAPSPGAAPTMGMSLG